MNQSEMSPDELIELASKLRTEVDIVLNKLLANFNRLIENHIENINAINKLI